MLAVAPASARGDDLPVHRVTYTVTADQPVQLDVYYRDVDPPTWADYSHNPYQFSPRDEASIGPGQSWVREVSLVNPDQWAMVAASIGSSPAGVTVRCELAVDGAVVASGDGPNGALCSLRHW
nr:hypothetical protein [Mycolicibacterium hodleri]